MTSGDQSFPIAENKKTIQQALDRLKEPKPDHAANERKVGKFNQLPVSKTAAKQL